MGNLDIYDKLRAPPEWALKQIEGGRLKGKTDIKPQWRYQAMTEQFGPCGIGWKYDLLRVWNEPLPDGQVLAFVEVAVRIMVDSKWSEPIPGVGGSMLVEQESSGLHASDEGYKMATTDALSVALKMLGVGADVYAGKSDGSKYDRPGKKTPEKGTNGITTETQHWCEEHSTPFFKKGSMRGFAHPIDGTKPVEWCDESDTKAAAKPKAAEKPIDPPAELAVDKVWLEASLKALNWNDCAKYLSMTYSVPVDRIGIMVGKLTHEQQIEFGTEVERRLEEYNNQQQK